MTSAFRISGGFQRLALATIAGLMAVSAQAQSLPAGYPADYQALVDAAKKEGTVTVYATTDAKVAAPLIKDFEALYGIKIEYNDLNSTELYNRLIAESAAGTGTGDVSWSSAPDLQIKLAVDGLALAYASPEIPALPKWAVMDNMAYGTTYEPMAIIYNKSQVPAEDVPQSHKDLAKLLSTKAAAYKGKITAYDPERSGVGFLMMNRDLKADPASWDLFKAMGAADIKVYTSAGAMIEKVGSGEHSIAYNIFASYGLLSIKKNPNLVMVWPKDYTLPPAWLSSPPRPSIRQRASCSLIICCPSAVRPLLPRANCSRSAAMSKARTPPRRSMTSWATRPARFRSAANCLKLSSSPSVWTS